MAGRETREGPDTGSDRGWTQPGQAVKGRDASGKSAGAETGTTWSDPAAAAPRETGHFWG